VSIKWKDMDEAVVFLVADPSSIGSSTAEFKQLIKELEATETHPLRYVLVDFACENDSRSPVDVLLEVFKKHSVSSGLNFLVGQRYGGVIALRLGSVFTKNSIAGMLLLGCPYAPDPAGSWLLEGPARVIQRAHTSNSLSAVAQCLSSIVWPLLLSHEVLSRYQTLSAESRAAATRASAMDYRLHLARVRRCVQPIRAPGTAARGVLWSGTATSWAELRLSQPRVVLVYGAADSSDAPNLACALNVPASRLLVVQGAGRQVVEEKPDVIATEINALVSEAAAAVIRRISNARNCSESRAVTNETEVSNPDDFATL